MTTGEAGIAGSAPIVKVRSIEETRRELEARQPKASAPSMQLEPVNRTGHLPQAPMNEERAKYEQMWKYPEYRAIAPGEHAAIRFVEIAQPKPGSVVIDFGAGTGRGALMLAIMGKVQVEMLDFAENCLDPEVKQALETQSEVLRFTLHDLTKPSPIRANYGFCVDVMEHIPPEQVDQVLINILKAARHVFFQISCTEDACGKMIDKPLHLSIHDHAWWLEKLQSLGAVVHWSKDEGEQCSFYVTGWATAKDVVRHGVLNTPEDKLAENIRTNMAAGWQELTPHGTNDLEIILLAGGPSLNDFEDDIRRRREEGAKLVTVNGTYKWALDRGLKVSAQIVVDGREFNARFTKPVMPDTKYLIASQVDPKVLEGLPQDRTYLWHANMEVTRKTLKELDRPAYMILSGSTVILRGLLLLRMLGFRKFHIYGWDSCLMRDAHHAYEQKENDGAPVVETEVFGRVFRCHPWMISQAEEFKALVQTFGDLFDLEVYGDGMIAHILKESAKIAENEVFV